MEMKEIDKIRKYLKRLQMQHFEEWIYMPQGDKIRLPQYIGKSLIWLLWKNKNYTIENKNGVCMFSFRHSSLTVICHIKAFWCTEAYGFNDSPLEQAQSPTKEKIKVLYTSLLLSPTITKDDIVKILDLKREDADLSLIENILTQ